MRDTDLTILGFCGNCASYTVVLLAVKSTVEEIEEEEE